MGYLVTGDGTSTTLRQGTISDHSSFLKSDSSPFWIILHHETPDFSRAKITVFEARPTSPYPEMLPVLRMALISASSPGADNSTSAARYFPWQQRWMGMDGDGACAQKPFRPNWKWLKHRGKLREIMHTNFAICPFCGILWAMGQCSHARQA